MKLLGLDIVEHLKVDRSLDGDAVFFGVTGVLLRRPDPFAVVSFFD